MIIGLFVLYIKFVPLYELDIRPWSYIFVKTPPTKKNISKGGDGTNEEPMNKKVPSLNGKVKGEHHGRTYVGNTRTIPNIYINTNFSKDETRVVILQADDSVEVRNSEAQIKAVRKCEFDKKLEGMRLQPI